MNYQEIQDLWIRNGGPPGWAPLMAGIALAESGGDTTALNPDAGTGDYSVGLWQINYFGSMLGPRSERYGTPEQLRADPNLQAKAAIDLFGGDNGAGLSNWTNDRIWNAWRAAGSPQRPDPNTVLNWVQSGGVSTGTAGTNGANATTAAQGGATLTARVTFEGKEVGCIPDNGVTLGFSFLNAGHIFTGCQLKAITGGLLVGLGGSVIMVGVIIVTAAALSGTGVGKAASTVLSNAGPIGKTGKAVTKVGKGVAKAGKAVGSARQARRDTQLERAYLQNRGEIQARNARYRSQERAAQRAGAPSRAREIEEPF